VRLDGLPLAIELAGAYLRYRSGASFAGYQELLGESTTSALYQTTFDSFTKHDADIASALVVHEALIEEAPALPDVLRALTWSASAAVSRSLLAALLPKHSPGALRQALDNGVSIRLLRRVPDADRYAIHRLVAEVRREQVEPPIDWLLATARRLADWFEERRNEFDQLEAYEADLDHLDEWTRRVEPHDPALAARLMWLQAYPPYHRGQPDLILDRLEQARTLFDTSGADDPEFDSHLLHDLSTALWMKGRHPEALPPAEAALAARRSTLGEGHPETARSLANIGTTLHELGRHEEALKKAEAALTLRGKALGGEHPETAHSLASVGAVLHSLGRHEEALERTEAALAARRAALGEGHPDTAHSLAGVGAVLHSLGRHEKAQNRLETAIGYLDESLGESHSVTLDIVGHLAAVYAARKQARRGLLLVKSRMRLADKALPVYAKLRALRADLSRQVPGTRQRPRKRRK
jgi:tetratricopeptide (TPR) repeat protein